MKGRNTINRLMRFEKKPLKQATRRMGSIKHSKVISVAIESLWKSKEPPKTKSFMLKTQ